MEKIKYRAYIQTRAILGISAVEITNELSIAYGDQAPEYRTIAKWAALFKSGREDINDDPRTGRPIAVHTASNIDLVSTFNL